MIKEVCKTKRKITHLLLFTYLFYIISFPIDTIFAASSISTATFSLNNQSGNISVNPGDTIGIYMDGVNNGTLNLVNVHGIISFTDNSQFTYDGKLSGGVNAENPIPLSSYSTTSGLSALITQGSDSTLHPGEYPFLYNGGFVSNTTASTYQQNVTAYFTGSDGTKNVISNQINKTIYVNVKPHITDYYFSKGGTKTNQIQGAGFDKVDLFLKVKDYNGCSNIDGGTIRANLAQIGLSNSENLIYDSCDSDGKTGIFKKTGITTMVPLGTYNFDATSFSAVDENGNQNALTDPNTSFSSEDKKSTDNLPLTVVAADAPSVSTVSLQYSSIGGSLQSSTDFLFSGNQDGETKVAVGSDGSCIGGTTLQNWSGTGTYHSGTNASITIRATDIPGGDGTYTVYGCIRNATMTVGSTAVTITKDTTVPSISSEMVSPNSVVTNDPTVSFKCSENGTYNVSIGGFSSSTGATAGALNSVLIPNANLSEGSNTINISCRDAATNKTDATVTVTKSTIPPSMSGSVIGFADNDIDYDLLDGRDLDFRWRNTTGSGYGYFQSYRLYLLPSNVAFDASSQAYIALLTDKAASSWIGDSSIKKDSTNTTLVSGGSYKMCIAILGSSGVLGDPGCSSPAVITSDIVQHPTILSARFSSGNILELTTDATLDMNNTNCSGGLVSFKVGSTTYTGASVSSINGKIIGISIPNLNDLAAVGSNLVVNTGALHAFSGGYNNYFSSGGLQIADGQAPTINNFINTTSSSYSNYFSGSITLSYNLGESLKAAGTSYIKFARTGGNPGSDKIYNITDTTKLTAGNHSITIDLAALGLSSGTYYDVSFVGTDLAGNVGNSQTISNVRFDNAGPAMISLNPIGVIGITNPTLSWLITSDDLGNGSGVKGYTLKIYNSSTCSGSYSTQNITDPLTLQYQTSLADMNNYAWTVSAYDNLGNQGLSSSCDSFVINTTVPSFSNQSIKDTSINSTQYTKGGNNVEITSNIANTDSSHIWLDASSMKDSSYSNISCASPVAGVTCSYSSGIAKYVFSSGFGGGLSSGVKQVRTTATNTAGINTGSVLSSITLDNSAPVISGNPITSPVSGSIFGGSSKNISWNTASITDNIGLSYLEFAYSSNGGSSWNVIGTGTNNSPYSWNMGSLSDGSNYMVKITAYDKVGSSASVNSQSFTIDKTPPAIGSLNLKADKTIYRGGQTANITWNNGNITDSNLGSNPINLDYSLDNGSSWTNISSSLANNGNVNWTIPGAVNSETVKIRLIASDSAGNFGSVIGGGTYFIDNTLPTVNVTFAGGGGSTPQNGKYINNSGLDLSADTGDSHMDKVYYSFQNLNDTTYWNQSGNGWIGVTSWNLLCSDNQALGTDNGCANVSQTISPSGIIDTDGYRLVVKAVDEAGNEKAYNPVDYAGDITAPNLNINTASGTYFSGSLNINGNSSDAGAGLSSTDIQIKKASSGESWNGTNWVNTGSLTLVTSGTAGNWNYSFSALSGDNDGETYNVNVLSHDQAFKTNNASTKSINVRLDKSGPTLSRTGFWSHPISGTGEIVRGGSSYNVQWDSSKISDNLSGIANIKLEYWEGSQYQPIASNIANSGSYSFTLPLLDIDSSIRLTAYDNVGNSNGIVSPTFTIDSTPPSITGIETVGDSAGQINGFIVRFSEITNLPVDAYKNFSLSIGTIAGMDIPVNTSTGTSVKLNLATSVGDTSTIPAMSYTAGARDITDRAGNNLPTRNNISSVDKAGAIIKKIEALDNDKNGKLDQFKLTFSENMAGTSSSGSFSINNSMPGISIISSSASGNIGLLNLHESDTQDTSTGGMTIGLANDGRWKDLNGNLASSPTMDLTDSAAPIIISSMTQDNDSDHKMDRFSLRFSESMTGARLSDFTIENIATGSSVSGLNLNSDKIDFDVNETSNDNDTGVSPRVNYASGSLQDGAGNKVSTITNLYVTDKIAPKLISRETIDNDHNGKIDRIKFVFSENLSGDASSYIADVTGYNISGYAFSGNLVYANVDEKQLFDTDAKPPVKIVSNSSLADTSGNYVETESGYTTASDKVGPVIVGARFDTTSNKIFLDFSENVSSSLTPASFNLSGATSNITSVEFTPGQKSGDVVLDGNGIQAGFSMISFSSNNAADQDGNKNPSSFFTKIVGSVIINEVMHSSVRNNQYIELRNLSSSSVDISGWTITNAGGNGVDLTIPASSSISANGHYLIAYSNSTFSGVTANFISSVLNLNPTTQNNLVLKSGTVSIDTVKANSWPSGDQTKISMERKNSCMDGTDSTCFYDGQDNKNFIDSTFRGTPGKQNMMDAALPSIDSFSPAPDSISPEGNKAFNFTYSDNSGGVGIDPASAAFSLSKWNGSSFDPVSDFSGGTIDTTHADFLAHNLIQGKYKASFSISDLGGNVKSQDVIFYVDHPTLNLSRSSVSMSNIKADGSIYYSQDLIVTLKSVGTSFDLKLGGDKTMAGPGGGIGNFDGSHGFGFDYSGEGKSFSGTLTAINDSTIGQSPANPDPDGNLRTFTYTIRYGNKIDALQAAGNYDSLSTIRLGLSY